jgi:hypothetical protein
MHQEHVVLTNVEIEQLYAAIKKYLRVLVYSSFPVRTTCRPSDMEVCVAARFIIK